MEWHEIPGWTCEGTTRLYYETALRLRRGLVVEVGVAYGKSLAFAASVMPPTVRIVGIDTWRDHMGGDNLAPEVCAAMRAHGTALDACRANLEACGVLDRVELIQAESVHAAERFGEAMCDLVFIDANHTLDALREDIAAWRPKVKPDGMLAGHDYSWDQFPGVIQAVCEAFGARRRVIDGVVWKVEGREL